MSLASPDNSNFDGWCQTKVESTNFSFLWELDNFSLLGREVGESLESSDFTVGTTGMLTKWCLAIYPNGAKANNEGSISLFLIRLLKPSKGELFASFSFCVLNSNGDRTYVSKCDCVDFCNKTSWGFFGFLKRSDVMDNASDILPNDKLTVCCDLTVIRPSCTMTLSGQNNRVVLEAESRVSEDLRSLLKSKKFSDVILQVRDKKFHAHKNILAARSPVFAAMFDEAIKQEMTLTTDVDEETFHNILVYIYTGKTPVLSSSQKVQSIMYAANRYGLDQLKAMCQVALSKIISVENAAEILLTAENFNARELKMTAVEYIAEHSVEVIETAGWKNVESRHPKLAIEIFRNITTSKIP